MYEKRNTIELGEYYTRHVYAMTAEQLHSKADIAAELAYRDKEIDRLKESLSNIADPIEHLKRNLTKGCEFDAHTTAILTSKVSFYKDLAKKALEHHD